MAQIDIGKIKPVFKGTYDNSTAYVLDDIVYYNGSSYVAKTSTTGNLPTDNTKWNLLASGSGGIWSSSLSLGSAGQVVKVNSGASALEFGTLSSDFVKINNGTFSGVTAVNVDGSTNWGTYSDYKFHKILLNFDVVGGTYAHIEIRQLNSGTAQTTGVYSWALNRVTSHNQGHSATASEGDNKIRISGDYFRGDNNAHHSVMIDIANLLKSSDNYDYLQITGMSAQVNQDGDQRLHHTTFMGNTHSNSAINNGRTGLQFIASTNTITGNYITYGIKG